MGVRVCSSLWDDFATQFIAGNKYLNDVVVGVGAGAVVDFTLYLLDERQLTYAAVRHHLTNLRAVFTINLGHVAIFDCAILTAARKVLTQRNSSPNLTEMLPQKLRPTQLPFTFDMLAMMHQRRY